MLKFLMVLTLALSVLSADLRNEDRSLSHLDCLDVVVLFASENCGDPNTVYQALEHSLERFGKVIAQPAPPVINSLIESPTTHPLGFMTIGRLGNQVEISLAILADVMIAANGSHTLSPIWQKRQFVDEQSIIQGVTEIVDSFKADYLKANNKTPSFYVRECQIPSSTVVVDFKDWK